MQWTDPDAPRIWRWPRSNSKSIASSRDEPLSAATIYTDDVLSRIAADGFNGIWIFCQLYTLMRSSVLPELNRAHYRLATRGWSLTNRTRRQAICQ